MGVALGGSQCRATQSYAHRKRTLNLLVNNHIAKSPTVMPFFRKRCPKWKCTATSGKRFTTHRMPTQAMPMLSLFMVNNGDSEVLASSRCCLNSSSIFDLRKNRLPFLVDRSIRGRRQRRKPRITWELSHYVISELI